MQPAPYGGFLTRTIDEEKEEKELVQKQLVHVTIDGHDDTLRPEAVHVRGVDNLATEQIESYVHMYLDLDTLFRIQWIDDSNANVVFKNHKDAKNALSVLAELWTEVSSAPTETIETTEKMETETETETTTEASPFSKEYLENLLVERAAKLYAATLDFHKQRMEAREKASGGDLFEQKKAEVQLQKETEEAMEEDGSAIVLYVRLAVQSDRKTKNAKEFSRYYLLHGEPDRSRRRRGGARGEFSREDDGADLFASKLDRSRSKKRDDDDDEDLFAWRMRERSPGRA